MRLMDGHSSEWRFSCRLRVEWSLGRALNAKHQLVSDKFLEVQYSGQGAWQKSKRKLQVEQEVVRDTGRLAK